MRTDAEIEALVRSFEDRTLPRSQWSHREHLLVALWYLRLYPRAEADVRITEGIKAYNAAGGRAGAYHETITLAWAAVVAGFLAEHDQGQSLSSLAGRLLETYGDKNHLLVYYSDSILMSEEARRAWVPPDLRPFEDEAPIERGRGLADRAG